MPTGGPDEDMGRIYTCYAIMGYLSVFLAGQRRQAPRYAAVECSFSLFRDCARSGTCVDVSRCTCPLAGMHEHCGYVCLIASAFLAHVSICIFAALQSMPLRSSHRVGRLSGRFTTKLPGKSGLRGPVGVRCLSLHFLSCAIVLPLVFR